MEPGTKHVFPGRLNSEAGPVRTTYAVTFYNRTPRRREKYDLEQGKGMKGSPNSVMQKGPRKTRAECSDVVFCHAGNVCCLKFICERKKRMEAENG